MVRLILNAFMHAIAYRLLVLFSKRQSGSQSCSSKCRITFAHLHLPVEEDVCLATLFFFTIVIALLHAQTFVSAPWSVAFLIVKICH